MGDANGSWQADAEQPRRANKGLVTAIAAAVVVLAVIGGTTGWLLAGNDRTGTANPGASASASSDTTTEPPISDPSPEPSVPPTPTATAIGGFALPDVSNQDFRQARQRLRGLGLGVQVFFGTSGNDATVDRTQPAGGATVRRGFTIKVYVRGEAPMATVPGVTGLPCNQAGPIVADHGLTPEYATGRTGVVLRQDPEPDSSSVRWNDRLRLFCGAPSAKPSASPSG